MAFWLGYGNIRRQTKMQQPDAECFSPTNLAYMRRFFKIYSKIICPQVEGELVGMTGLEIGTAIYPQVGGNWGFMSLRSITSSRSRRTSRPLGFLSARRRTTRWSNGRLSRRNSPLAFPNIASARFCQMRLQATFRASPTSNLQLAEWDKRIIDEDRQETKGMV